MCLSIVDSYRIVVAVETMNKRLDGWFIEVSDIRGRLAWFLAKHERLRVDQSEGVNDNLALD